MNGSRLFRVVLALFLCLGATAEAESTPADFFAKPLTLGAHRGGRSLWPENTLVAFENAARQWPDILLEGDLQTTKDGHVILLHDDTVDRTTNGSGKVASFTLDELKTLDAGYHFTRDGGQTFPYRGQGVTIPTFAEVLRALPESRFLVEMKLQTGLAEATIRVLRECDAVGRVAIASFSATLMKLARDLEPNVLTCCDLANGMDLLQALRSGDWDAYAPPSHILAVDQKMLDGFALTPDELARLGQKGVVVMTFTVNNDDAMRRLLDLGIPAILTDRPDLLAAVIAERAAAPTPASAS